MRNINNKDIYVHKLHNNRMIKQAALKLFNLNGSILLRLKDTLFLRIVV